MEKLKMHTPDFTDANIARLAELFPNCVTESADENGNLIKAVDFDLLKQELSGSLVEGTRERYHLDWVGKREALLTANAPIAKTLRPVRDDSVDFDTTKNLYIEGDNLDALKLLQETYLGKVKMIYIDPPYNTGRNLMYKNDFSENTETFFRNSLQEDFDGNRLVTNFETNGRFHSDWLSMMYARLKLAKNLLAKDGVLVCAIDENEQPTLMCLLKEIFLESGYEHVCVSVIHNPGGIQGTNFSYCHEYAIFVYPSNGKFIGLQKRDDDGVDIRPLRDVSTGNHLRIDAANCFYPIYVKDEKVIGFGDVCENSFHPESVNIVRDDGIMEIYPIDAQGNERKWVFARQTVESIIGELSVEFNSKRKIWDIIRTKRAFNYKTVWTDKRYNSNAYGAKLLSSLLPNNGFTFPKSLYTVLDSVDAITQNDKNALILDFFSGSATTAHAVMQLNAEDGGNRQFIMVQLPEATDEKSEAFKAGYKTIAEIGKERIRRAGNKLQEEVKSKQAKEEMPLLDADSSLTTDHQPLDTGFRVLKIDSSNMKDVYYSPDKVDQGSLLDAVTHIKEDRTAEDLLFQVLVDWGIDLRLPIACEQWAVVSGRWTVVGKEQVATHDVYFVDENTIAACFDEGITEDFVKELANRQPLRAVFRDSGFANDNVKINAEQIFKMISPTTEVKTI